MSLTLRDVLDQHWSELEAVAPSAPDRLRTSELPVDTANGRLVAAIDHAGHRHVMVPLTPHQHLRHSGGAAALRLEERPLVDGDAYQRFADLCCLRDDLNDVFTGLCGDVLKMVEALPERPLRATYVVLDKWRALFQASRAPLGQGQLAGLFGELTVLLRLLARDGGAQELWTGPTGHRHDFVATTRAIEVKASTADEGRRARVHGLDQLEVPEGGTLCLVWFRVSHVGGRGESVVDLADRARRLCDNESGLLTRLADAGFRPVEADAYRDIRFEIIEERWYEVDASFPKLTENRLTAFGIPPAVLDVHYTIDLSNEPPVPLQELQVHEYLASMLREEK